MRFTAEQLSQLADEYRKVRSRHDELMIAYVCRQWENPRAREFATHGLSRRLSTLVRCIEKVFALLPPEVREVPEDNDRIDATICIQAFVFNIFGCLDNFAWILVSEKNITSPDGRPLRNLQINISKQDSLVRHALSEGFIKYLDGLRDWFSYQEGYRHSLAHRIPLYIPPYTVDPKNKSKFRELGELMASAAKACDFAEYDKLDTQQKTLGTFSPLMQHSFAEGARPVVFHVQLLADFKTIIELGEKVLSEIGR